MAESRSPEYTLTIRGDELPAQPGKKWLHRYRYHEIGVGWEEKNGVSFVLDFPVPITITSETKLRMFKRNHPIEGGE